MKDRKRNIKLVWSPEVKIVGTNIIVTSGEYRAGTKFQCRGELSLYCAGGLVRDLRKAMHEIRKQQVADMNRAIANAEQEIP